MALRVANPVYLTRSANLPPATTFTLMGWSIVPTGQTGTLVSVTGATGGPEFYYNYVVADGKYYFGSYNGGAYPGNDFSAGLPGADVWFHWYVTRSGNTLEAGFRAVGQTSYTVHQITLSTSPAWSALHINTDPFSNFGDANYAAIKLWDVALSADQILAESYTLRPQTFASLNLFTPMLDSSVSTAYRDLSGNGRDWAATGGTPSVADGPPVSWGARPLRASPRATAGATGSIATTIPLTAGWAATLGVTGTVARALPLAAAFSGVLGVTGAVASSFTLSASIVGKIGFTGALAGTPTLTASITGAYGATTGTIAVALPITAAITGKQGFAGTAAITVPLAAAIAATFAPPITGSIDSTLRLVSAFSAAFTVPGQIDILLIPPGQNMDLLRQRANTILSLLQNFIPTYGPGLPAVDSKPDGALFMLTTDATLYQMQNGAWVAVDGTP